MSKQDKTSSGAPNDVGYRRPPRHAQFKKGQSGNPHGAPRRKGKLAIDFDALIDSPISITVNGKAMKMCPKEIELRKITARALKGKGDVKAIRYLLNQFKHHDIVKRAEAPQSGGVLTMPNTMPLNMAMCILTRFGAPPWSKREIDMGRLEYVNARSAEQKAIDDLIDHDG